ncbi:hypothetical protein EB061_12845, partial [bacterium]|nr:hypothetical protein [bacterium]
MGETPDLSASSRGRLELLAAIVIPWGLDLLGQRRVLASAFGAILWGMILVIALLRPRTRDSRLRHFLGWAIGFLAGSWLTYWLVSFLEAPRALQLAPEALRMLTLLHAGLLAAGVGMVALIWIGSAAWLLQESLLRKKSWERRRIRISLPSLEALSR